MIPDGYKKWPHEGLLPETWKVLFASEVCSKITDGTHDTPSPTATGIPYITAVHVKGGFINFKDCKYLPQDVHNGIYKRCNSEKGDLLVVNIGAGVSDCGYVNVDFEFSLKNVALLKPNETKITSEFLFQHHQFRKTKIAHQVKAGGAQPFLSLKELKRLRFVIPPLPEQKKIAQILSTWDKAIATVEKLIANSQQKKKALMQQLLTGKKRFPEFDGEWKKIELGKLLDYKQPTPFLVKSTKYLDEYSIPVLTAGKTFVLGYTNETFGIYQENLPVIIFDDFTTASKFVNFPFKAKSSAMKLLTAKQGISIKYIFEAMQMINYSVGGHQRHWISIYSNLVVHLPPLEEQQKIASVLSSADQEIETWQQELENLKQEKKALMQQLFTGKRRVKVDVSATETLQLGGSHEV